ncbi:MAG: hypothetical protein ACJ790_17385 [Myxococcaceae bacterium]
MSRGLFVAALLLSLASAAQTFSPDQRLYLSEGILRGSPRLMGLSGAYVAIAEGAEGQTRNPAAVAQKDPRFERDFTVDFAGTMHFLFPGAVRQQDWDNDGEPDQPPGAGPNFAFGGAEVVYSTASVQYKSVGLGAGFDLQNFHGLFGERRDGADVILAHIFASLGASFWDDNIAVGVGVESSHAALGYFTNRQLNDSLTYHGWGYQFGALWRPKDQNYRLGFSFKPATVAEPTDKRSELGKPDPQLQTFRDAVAPGRLSFGGSWALGSGGRNYNIANRAGLIDTGTVDENGLPVFSAAMTKWLISAQVDVQLPVQGATTFSAFLAQREGTPPALVAGDKLSFLPRLGIEKEVWPDHFRIRGGGYLEPALVDTGTMRPHVTVGVELYLFKVGPQRLSFGLSFDFAQRYQNLSVAIVVWK